MGFGKSFAKKAGRAVKSVSQAVPSAKKISKASKAASNRFSSSPRLASKSLKSRSGLSRVKFKKIAKAASKARTPFGSSVMKAANAILSSAMTAGRGIAGAAKKAGSFFSRLIKKAIAACTPKPKHRDLRTKPKRTGKQPGDKTAREKKAKDVFPGQQSYNNCGVQSSAQIIGVATGNTPKEDDLLTTAIDNDWADSGGITAPVGKQSIPTAAGGTGPSGRQKILSDSGVSSASVKYSEEALADAIWNQKGVIASIHTDGASWWKNPDGTTKGSGKHAIVITDGDFDKDGNLTHVYINDTGIGQRKKVSIADFNKAAVAHDSPHLNITDKAIWP